MSELFYLAGVIGICVAYIGGVWLLWQGVELAYFIYCKATGREY